MPENEPDPLLEALEQQFRGGGSLLAIWALEVPELDQRHRRVLGPQPVVIALYRWGELEEMLAHWRMLLCVKIATLLSERPVHELHARRPFAHRRGYALHAAATDIPHREDSRHGGLEHIRLPRQRPATGGEILRMQFGARPDEPLVIQGDAARQPTRVGNCAGHEKDMMDRLGLGPLVARAVPGELLQARVTLERSDLRRSMQSDVGSVLDASDEISGHALGEAIRAHEQMHMPTATGEEYGCLPRGVAAADHDDFLVLAELRLDKRRRVIDTHPEKAVDVGQFQLAVFHAAGDHDGAAADHPRGMKIARRVAGEMDLKRLGLAAQAQRAVGDRHFRAKLLCLHERPPSQRLPGDAGRKAEVV